MQLALSGPLAGFFLLFFFTVLTTNFFFFFFFFDYDYDDYDDYDDDYVGSRRRRSSPRRCNWHCLGLWYVFFYSFFFTVLMIDFFFFFFDYDYDDYDDDDDDYVGFRRRRSSPRRCNWHCLGLWYVFFLLFFFYCTNN